LSEWSENLLLIGGELTPLRSARVGRALCGVDPSRQGQQQQSSED